MSQAVLALENITAGYGAVQAIRSLDLTVGYGEVVGILGSNGAGKTTVLKTVSGTTAELMAGRIVFEGHDLAKRSPTARARLGIAHVPEGRGLFQGLTVGEHFRLGYKGEQLDTEFCYSHFPALRDLRNRRSGLLSGGEQQMLAIGRAIARRPKLLLLDELSLGLAPIVVERILPVVRNYAKDSGCGVLLVEQHTHSALQIIDRGYVLAHGELVMHASSDELRANQQLVHASYLGESR